MPAPPMDEIVDLVTETPVWDEIGLKEIAEMSALTTLRHLDLPEEAEISLLATTDARIAELNVAFRARESATNVLSWPAEELGAETDGGAPALPEPDFPGEPVFLGDIAMAWETCRREALESSRPVPAHVTHLFVHGLLHLLGYDHMRDADAALMERLEVEILAKLGVPDPY